jgi:hypothetical protein
MPPSEAAAHENDSSSSFSSSYSAFARMSTTTKTIAVQMA